MTLDTTQRQSWRQLRQAKGLSLRDLEKRTGVNRGRLSVIERGLPPSPAEAQAILQALA
jgi:transcriptional regulator with XRE-family HTH domain